MKKLHIIAFNNPYPPNYGGVIDIFYKIKALKEQQVAIFLHVFQYNREPSQELEQLCEKVYYYPRKTGFLFQFSWRPYIVESRRSQDLISNLCKDDNPILFEGLHCCYYLDDLKLKDRIKMVRMHNIEHEYYAFLRKSSHNFLKSLYYRLESIRLRYYEKIITQASVIFGISESDTGYFSKKYGHSVFLGAFHANNKVKSLPGRGEYILMHGNLEVEENESAVLHCLDTIFSKIDFPVVIAGKNPTSLLREKISSLNNCKLVENPDSEEMERLLLQAHIHLCYTFQASGLKLKLLNSLFMGRFVVANPLMVKGSGLAELCEISQSDQEMTDSIKKLFNKDFKPDSIQLRENGLQSYANKLNAQKILNYL